MLWYYYRLLIYRKLYNNEILYINETINKSKSLFNLYKSKGITDQSLILFRIKLKKWPIIHEKVLERYKRKYFDIVSNVENLFYSINYLEKKKFKSQFFLNSYLDSTYFFNFQLKLKKISKTHFKKLCLKKKEIWQKNFIKNIKNSIKTINFSYYTDFLYLDRLDFECYFEEYLVEEDVMDRPLSFFDKVNYNLFNKFEKFIKLKFDKKREKINFIISLKNYLKKKGNWYLITEKTFDEKEGIFSRLWLQTFIKQLIKCGKIEKSKKVVIYIQKKLYNFCKEKKITFDSFFYKIYSMSFLPFIYRKRIVAGKTYPIPIGLGKKDLQQKNLISKKIIFFARQRKEKNIEEKLYLELIDIYNRTSSFIRSRDEYLKGLIQTKANRRFLIKKK